MPELLRTFIALELPSDIKEQIAHIQFLLQKLHCDVRWEPIEKFHITLKFLGPTPKHLIPKLTTMLSEYLKSQKKFSFQFNHIGAFPTVRNPKVVWIGIDQPIVLESLACNIDVLCKSLGFPAETKKYHPHVTFGRVKGNQNITRLTEAIKTSTFESIYCECNTISLIQSELKPEGSHYTIVQSFLLQ